MSLENGTTMTEKFDPKTVGPKLTEKTQRQTTNPVIGSKKGGTTKK